MAGGVEPIDLHCVVRGVGSPPACLFSSTWVALRRIARAENLLLLPKHTPRATVDEVVAGVLGTDSIPIESEM